VLARAAGVAAAKTPGAVPSAVCCAGMPAVPHGGLVAGCLRRQPEAGCRCWLGAMSQDVSLMYGAATVLHAAELPPANRETGSRLRGRASGQLH
jgi:hypothetical protein